MPPLPFFHPIDDAGNFIEGPIFAEVRGAVFFEQFVQEIEHSLVVIDGLD